MIQFFLAVFAVYLMAVGVEGNGREFIDTAISTGEGFVPYIFVIGGLGVLSAIPETEKLAKPFFALFIISIILTHYQTIAETTSAIYQDMTGLGNDMKEAL
jgi:hypothetical protein